MHAHDHFGRFIDLIYLEIINIIHPISSRGNDCKANGSVPGLKIQEKIEGLSRRQKTGQQEGKQGNQHLEGPGQKEKMPHCHH
jgi:hypothetical protein